MNGTKRCCLFGLAILGRVGVAMGQATSTVAAQTAYSVPDAPAFTFLNASPTRVSRPGTARDLAVALADGIDSLGRARQGFALDASVWSLIPGSKIALEDYQRSRSAFVLANLQTSFGTVRPTGDTTSTDLAFGLRALLADGADPMRDTAFTSGMQRALADCNGKAGTPLPSVEEALACGGRAVAALRKRWLSEHWNAPSFALAAALGTRLDESNLDNARWAGWSAWAAGSLPLGTSGQLAYQLRYDDRPALGANPLSKTLSYGARAATGSSSVNGFLELVGQHLSDSSTGSARTNWSGGIEFLAASDLWVSTGFGSAYNAAVGAGKILLLANVRWNVASSPHFTTR
jgi:hypothetical protein